MIEMNKVHLMDCMDGMKDIPDKFFELAIVDPPYGVGSVTYMPSTRVRAFGGFLDKYQIDIVTLDLNQRKKMKVDVVHNKNSDKTIRNFGDENVSPPPAYFEELFRVSRNQIIWGGNYFILPPSRGFVVWKKTTVSESFSMSMCEYAWMSYNENSKIWEGAPQGTAVDPRIHPTQKPIPLYKWLLKNYAKPGDKILDTHVGSGSSIIACIEYKHDYMGFEIDPDYHKAAQERIEAFESQVMMF